MIWEWVVWRVSIGELILVDNNLIYDEKIYFHVSYSTS